MPERCSGDHPHLYSFFKHENGFYHVREGDLFGGPFFLYKSNSCMADAAPQSQAVEFIPRALFFPPRGSVFHGPKEKRRHSPMVKHKRFPTRPNAPPTRASA